MYLIALVVLFFWDEPNTELRSCSEIFSPTLKVVTLYGFDIAPSIFFFFSPRTYCFFTNCSFYLKRLRIFLFLLDCSMYSSYSGVVHSRVTVYTFGYVWLRNSKLFLFLSMNSNLISLKAGTNSLSYGSIFLFWKI